MLSRQNICQPAFTIEVKELEKQLQEKKLLSDMEKAIDNKYCKSQIYAASEADKLENQIIETKRKINQEINHFRKTYQRKNDKEENQRNGNKYLTEPGISSGLIFDGEDSGAHDRKQLQVQQQKCWLLQQISEKKQISKEISFAEKLHSDSLKARENRALILENLEKECRKQIQSVIKDYNKTLAKEQISKKALINKKEREDNERDVINAMTSDLLTENPEVAQSNLGCKKIIQYHYKGMSERELLEIRKAQMDQIKERQIMADAENSLNKKWDNFYKEMDQIQQINYELHKTEEREKNQLLMEKNKFQCYNTKANVLRRKKEEASNFCTPEFLNQLNKTSR